MLTFFLFLLVASRLYDPLQAALQNLAAVISTRTNIARMREILDHPIQQGTTTLTNRGCDIVFDHVGFAYHTGEQVLRDVSFTAKQGRSPLWWGPSGGGKTTVSRLAARFWDLDQGRITVGGMDIAQVDPETLLSLYAIVFQDVTLFDNTILENIRIGRKDATDEEVLAAARLANCDEFAEKLPEGWHTRIGENGGQLSGGGGGGRCPLPGPFEERPHHSAFGRGHSVPGRGERDLDPERPLPADPGPDGAGYCPPDAHRGRGGQDRGPRRRGGGRGGQPQDLLRQGGKFARMVRQQTASQTWTLPGQGRETAHP